MARALVSVITVLGRAARRGGPAARPHAAGIAAAVLVVASLAALVAAWPTALGVTLPTTPSLGAAPPARRLHAGLLSSEPASGDTLSVPLDRVRLFFSESVEETLSELVLEGGGRNLPLTPRRDARNTRLLTAELPPLIPGKYRLAWRIVSTDGHRAAGSFAFYVGEGAGPAAARTAEPAGVEPAPLEAPADAAQASGTSALEAPDPGTAAPELTRTPVASDTHGGSTDEPSAAAALSRALSLGALLSLSGLLALLAWLAPGPAGRLGRLALVLATLTPPLLAADFGLWLRQISPDGRLDAGLVGAGLHTQSGRVAAAGIVLSTLAFCALVLARRPALAAALGFAAILLTAATGHPAAIHPWLAVPAKAVHLVAVALWLGGLLALVVGRGDAESFRADARRVSAMALAAVVALAITGLIQAVAFLDSPGEILTSTYGRLVAAKLAGLAVLVLFGARHRFRLLPPLAAGGPSSPLRRWARAETLVMAAVIVLAAFLAYVPTPDSGAPQTTASTPATHPTRAASGGVSATHARVEALP
jgi:putative copper resistance protein D